MQWKESKYRHCALVGASARLISCEVQQILLIYLKLIAFNLIHFRPRVKLSPGVNSIKKYKCTLQVGPLFLQIHTNLNPLKVFTISC